VSILLSAYFPEGVVFAADKNVTLLYDTAHGPEQDVEVGVATKVIPWAHRRAVVGYCGLAVLSGLPLQEWLRQFAAKTREFDDLSALAHDLKAEIQRDFDRDFPERQDVVDAGLIVHLGGFRQQGGVAVPAMYYISNVSGLIPNGRYGPAQRTFSGPSDELSAKVDPVGAERFRSWLADFYAAGNLLWFNNGLHYSAFNVFRQSVWSALDALRRSPLGVVRQTATLEDRVAYCRMAVDLYDSFFRYHFEPRHRSVGGGSDAEWVPWPEPGTGE